MNAADREAAYVAALKAAHGTSISRKITTLDAAITAAILVEREKCAQEAEQWLNRPRCKATAVDIAAAIRARGGA